MAKKEVKVVYFITLLIKFIEIKPIKGSNLPMKTEKQTLYQSLDKNAINEFDALNRITLEAQQRFSHMRILAHTITMLTPQIFEVNEGDNKKEENLKLLINKQEEESK